MAEADEEEWVATLSDDGRVLSLAGRVVFTNARKAYRDVSRLLQDSVERIDCGGLQRADSTALALLLAAASRVSREQRSLQISGLNPRLQSLAHVYGIEDILQLEPDPQ